LFVVARSCVTYDKNDKEVAKPLRISFPFPLSWFSVNPRGSFLHFLHNNNYCGRSWFYWLMLCIILHVAVLLFIYDLKNKIYTVECRDWAQLCRKCVIGFQESCHNYRVVFIVYLRRILSVPYIYSA